MRPTSRFAVGLLFLLLIPASGILAAPVPPPASSGLGVFPGPEIPSLPAHPAPAALRRFEQYLDRRNGRLPLPAQREDFDVLAVLVQFQDRVFPEEYEEDFDPLNVLGFPDSVVTTPRLQWFSDRLERVNDYYRTMSSDLVSFNFTVGDTLTLPGEMSLYGDDELPWGQALNLLAADAVALLDDNTDFSLYDLVVFIHAGPGQESDLLRDSPEQIWSGYLDHESLRDAFADSIPDYEGIATNDLGGSFFLTHFAVAPEEEVEESLDPPYVLGCLGVYVHQFGGFLGLVSLGDYVDPRAQGVGNFDLMGTGLWNALGFVPGPPSAFNLTLMGWAEVLEVAREDCQAGSPSGGQALRVGCRESGADTLLLRLPISDREYFLIENREQDPDSSGSFTFDDANGNHLPDNAESLLGAEFDYFTTQYNMQDTIPGSGLFIWRIDEELIHLSFQWGENVINGWNDHYGVRLLEADGYPDLSETGYSEHSYGGDFDAFRAEGGHSGLVATQTEVGGYSYPNTRSAQGALTGWRLHGIGTHGRIMDLIAYWEEGHPLESFLLEDRMPAGDILAADFIDEGEGQLELVFAAGNGADSTWLYAFSAEGGSVVESDGDPGTIDPLLSLEGVVAGAPASGDLDQDGLAEVVLLTTDGRLLAFNGDGTALFTSFQNEPLASHGPLVADLDRDGDYEIVTMELIDSEADSTRLCLWDGSGAVWDPPMEVHSLWQKRFPGAPACEIALSYEVPPSQRGLGGHGQPGASFISMALAGAADEDGSVPVTVHRLMAWLNEEWGEITEAAYDSLHFEAGSATVDLSSADLDGDGTEEVVIQSGGELRLWYPRGRWSGASAGEILFSSSLFQGSGGAALVGDLDGNGSLEPISLLPDQMAVWSADALLLADQPWPIPRSEAGQTGTLSAWALLGRGEAGRDKPLFFSRDGRLFGDLPVATGSEPAFLGGNLVGSPALVDADADGLLEIHGLSSFQPIEGNTWPEDTLQSGARLRYWRGPTDLAAHGASWSMGGADGGRTRRLGAAGELVLPESGTASFLEAYPYPNPAGSKVTWRVRTDSPDAFSIQIFDLEGQVLWEDEGQSDGFGPWEQQCSLDGFASGVYFFRVHSPQSGRESLGRLAVIR